MVRLGLLLCGIGLARAQGCCTSDMDCVDMMSPADVEYLNQFGKTLECDPGCPGLINCNMFGLCEQCRGCFETCEGAAKYMEETSALPEFITFCSGVGISDLSDCDGASGEGSGSASSGDSGSASGGGMDSTADDITASSASGAGSGSASSGSSGSASGAGSGSASSGGGVGSASGAGSGSASSAESGSASGSGMNSGSGDGTAGYASGAGSGSGSMSSSMATASGSGDASRIADIDGCDCGSAELEPSFAAYFCDNQKSMYCDLECVDDADSANFLFPSLGGLWCQPEGWEGCRMCKFDCSDYEGDCVPCPTGVKNWC